MMFCGINLGTGLDGDDGLSGEEERERMGPRSPDADEIWRGACWFEYCSFFG